MNVIIPSYGRSQTLPGKDYFYTARYCVPESQADEYCKVVGNDRVLAIPDEYDGNICRKRNWILENTDFPLVMVDDDVASIGYFEGRRGMKNGEHRPKTLDPDLFVAFCEQSFELCRGFGARMWGIGQNEDNRIYKEFQPLSLSKVTLGPFQGHLEHDLVFDERVGTKDDYDMALQQLYRYHVLMRWNKFHYICEHGENAGGIVSYRSKAKEIEYCKAIMAKWGKGVIKYKLPPEKMNDLLNARWVNVPIEGV